ncbi:hypothetical protein OG739_18340 [Streptomyces longwoodensis]|uniref:hypothetical protein n=1 Tax=Streptomyces longwoodensis TaxID=68231 RepID=UPI0022581214|nr:hypothetical protein [Streptomyces longwoodensis]MCX4994675.1 hypothetical protein [Streptomyces longwoodensis]WRY89494.1 hypothetical protein OG481_13700 [Streptomyces longwoodensis]WTI46227.1 hypothetical protein OG547_17755 [Streptomyces longwoodensis]WUC59015.1 hypothetical protein OHA09_18855 [Streptomyces longwoodensis]WUC72518.1 hypothetical protein OG416_17725 [Streptomyces longwoodensis]
MFSTHKTAAAAVFVGSLAAFCLGVTQAHAEGKSSDCPATPQGGVVCVQKNESYIDEDGTQVTKQDQQCSTVDRPNVVVEQDQLLGNEPVRKEGAVVECSNTAKLPEGFQRPHTGF